MLTPLLAATIARSLPARRFVVYTHTLHAYAVPVTHTVVGRPCAGGCGSRGADMFRCVVMVVRMMLEGRWWQVFFLLALYRFANSPSSDAFHHRSHLG